MVQKYCTTKQRNIIGHLELLVCPEHYRTLINLFLYQFPMLREWLPQANRLHGRNDTPANIHSWDTNIQKI
jgi:hypothetical protein